MYNILFVCYGNICRSPMAEMIFKDLIFKNNKRYLISCESMATSVEEIGNGIYPKAYDKLISNGINVEKHVARQFKKDDYLKYDFIVVFEEKNRLDLLNVIGTDYDNKIKLLLEFTSNSRDIEDPWYTDDFDTAYSLILEGCKALYNYLLEKGYKDEF